MIDTFILAWRSLTYYWFRNLLLVAALAMSLFVPATVYLIVQRASAALQHRAAATPMLVGAKGSVTDLTLRSLYFQGQPLPTMTMAGTQEIEAKWAATIPLHLRFRARGVPVVGTTPDYFRHRRLRIREGQTWQRLGDCVLGHEAARQLKLKAGDALTTEAEIVLGLSGAYPLRMRITGVLAPSASPDDVAVFVDVRTAWIIEGIGHGHAASQKHDDNVTGIQRYNEVTDANADSFHFHGSQEDFPISAAIVLPVDSRADTILLGRYESHERLQLAEPPRVMPTLLRSVLQLRWYVILGASLVGIATTALVALVLLLSFRLRRAEFLTLRRIGASRRRVAAILLWECLVVAALSVTLAAGLTIAASQFDSVLLRQLM